MAVVEPGDTKLRWFHRAGVLLSRTLPSGLRRFLSNLLFGVTPAVPTTLLDLPSTAHLRRTFVVGALVALVLCFGGTLFVTYLSDTLVGLPAETGNTRLYFLDDRTNLINYSIICPLYVGLAAAFIVAVWRSWRRVRRSPLVRGDAGRHPRCPIGLAAFIVPAAAFALTTRYIWECLNPAIYHRAAWYVRLVGTERVLNVAGIYYVLLNFSLLLLSLTAFVHLGLFACVAAEVGRALRSRAPANALNFQRLSKTLQEFTWAYILVKLLAAAYIANAFTWKWEKPQGSFNLPAMVWVLVLFGVFVVSFPRYYIEIEWFYFKARRAEASGGPIPHESDDIRDKWIRDLATILDIAFGVTTAVSLL